VRNVLHTSALFVGLTMVSYNIHLSLLINSFPISFSRLPSSYSTYKMNRNSFKGQYLQSFLGHSHLGDGRQWHSIVGMRARFEDYFSALSSAPPQRVTVVVGGSGSRSSNRGLSRQSTVPTTSAAPSSQADRVDFDWAAFRKTLLQMDLAGAPALCLSEPTKATASCSSSVPKQEASQSSAGLAPQPPLPQRSYAPWAARTPSPEEPQTAVPMEAAPGSSDTIESGLDSDTTSGEEQASGHDSVSSGAMGAHPDLLTWSKAASSRARNPYLPPKPPQEFEEVVVPAELAQELLDTCQVLAKEWVEDLGVLAWQDSAEARQQRQKLETSRRRVAQSARRDARNAAAAAAADPEDPALAEAASRAADWAEQSAKAAAEADAASAAPAFESAERGRVGESSPLRRLSFDLLLRAVTLAALKDLQAELILNAQSPPGTPQASKNMANSLSSSSSSSKPKGAYAAAAAHWLATFLKQGDWFAQLAEATPSLTRPNGHDVASDPVAARLLEALDLHVPLVAYDKNGREATPRVDPAALAQRVRDLRAARATQFQAQLRESGPRCEAVAAQCASRAMLERASGLDLESSRTPSKEQQEQ